MPQRSTTKQSTSQKSKLSVRSCIHLVSGDKGGTGKSAFSSLLVDYFTSKDIALRAIDGDITNPTLSMCYPDAVGVVVSDDRDQRNQLNIIFLAAQEDSRLVVVDLPARSEVPISGWLDAYSVIELAKECNIDLVKWWLSDGEPSTIDMFVASVKEHPDIPHVFVKNMGLAKPIHWAVLEENTDIQKWYEEGKIEVTELPWVHRDLINKVRRARRSFLALSEDKGAMDIMTRGCMSYYLREGFRALEATQVIADIAGSAALSSQKKADPTETKAS